MCYTYLNHKPDACMPSALVQSNARPFVLLRDLRSPLSWNEGLFLKIRFRASHVLLSSHSVAHFSRDAVTDLPSRGWTSFTCMQSDDSLCRHSEQLDFFNSRLVQQPYVYGSILRRDYPLGMDVCAKNSGRQIVNSSLYTVSMCDMIDAGMQFVLVEHTDERKIFYKSDSTSIAEYALLALVCFYAVATLAKHGVLLIKSDAMQEKNANEKSATKTFIVEALSKYISVSLMHIAVIVCVFVLVITNMHRVATRSELYLAWYLIVYILWDAVFCLYRVWSRAQDQLKQINLMVVLLMLCCLRLYHTFQNVFHAVFIVMFSIRTCCKVVLVMTCNADSNESTNKLIMSNMSVMYDVITLYVILLCMNCAIDTVPDIYLHNISVLVVGVTIGSIIALMHRCRPNTSCVVDAQK